MTRGRKKGVMWGPKIIENKTEFTWIARRDSNINPEAGDPLINLYNNNIKKFEQ